MGFKGLLSSLSDHCVLIVVGEMTSMLIDWFLQVLSSYYCGGIRVVVHALITHNFFQHLQLVLHPTSLHLLFLHKKALWLLTHDDRSAKLLRLRKVLTFRNWLIWLCGTSDFAVRNFQGFLGCLCHIVVVKWGWVNAKGPCVYFLNDHGVFHRLELWSQVDKIICFGCVFNLAFTLENQVLAVKLRAGCGFFLLGLIDDFLRPEFFFYGLVDYCPPLLQKFDSAD